jgi:putative transposase
MRFAFVARHRHIWPVSWLCEVLEVSRSGFHAWLNRPSSARAIHDAKLVMAIETSFKASDRTSGARRVWRDVLEEGLACGLHRIERLMRVNALRARPRRRGKPKDDGERSVIADNILDRDFQAERPNQKWLADFTYIWTAEGWLYVAVVMDLFSRRVVGWSMKADRDASLVMDALMMAVWRRGKADALLHHSDQGSQYTSEQVSAPAGRQRHHLFDEPGRQRLGQFGDGELLLVAEDRTHGPQGLPHSRRSPCRRVRLHRALLQPAQTAL